MSFEWPLALLGLLAIPLTALLYSLAQRRRRAYAVRFTNLELLGSVVTSSPGLAPPPARRSSSCLRWRR